MDELVLHKFFSWSGGDYIKLPIFSINATMFIACRRAMLSMLYSVYVWIEWMYNQLSLLWLNNIFLGFEGVVEVAAVSSANCVLLILFRLLCDAQQHCTSGSTHDMVTSHNIFYPCPLNTLTYTHTLFSESVVLLAWNAACRQSVAFNSSLFTSLPC